MPNSRVTAARPPRQRGMVLHRSDLVRVGQKVLKVAQALSPPRVFKGP